MASSDKTRPLRTEQWIPAQDPTTGNFYFWDPITQSTTWDLPAALDLSSLVPTDPFFASKEYADWYAKYYSSSQTSSSSATLVNGFDDEAGSGGIYLNK